MSTYSQIYIYVVFAVKGRESLISSQWEEKLYKYITGIVQNKQQKMLAINGMPDHIHFLIGMKPSCCLSDLVREIKKSTNTYIKEEKLSKFKYIMNQKEHHKKKKFKEEYVGFLKKFNVDYNDEYLFDWIE